MTPNAIQFHDINSTWVMRITADRRIEVNDDVEVTDAAKKVLEAMQSLLDAQRTWVGLTDEEIELLEELYAPPVHPDFVDDADHCFSLIKKIEAKLKERNT